MHSITPSDNPRRLFLRVVAKLMLAFGLVTALWVVLSPLLRPNVPVNAKTVETRINISTFAPDTVDIIEWFDKPLVIARRSEQTQINLAAVVDTQLRDAGNQRSDQPAYAKNSLRSASAEWFVAIALGTSSGCALRYREAAPHTTESAVLVDGCDGSRFDLAGRALAGSQARKNLPVPHWRVDGDRIVVSTDPVRD